jgi:hypothetical protein
MVLKRSTGADINNRDYSVQIGTLKLVPGLDSTLTL